MYESKMENQNSEEQTETTVHSTTHLDFKQAMQDFQTMFPEMDEVVIEEVLRSNQGEVDATIDQLLSMTTDNLNEALRLHLEEEENRGDFTRNECGANYPDVAKSSILNTNQSKKWHPPLIGPLPPTFLKISLPQKAVPDCGEDERIALFLQNEEFLSELRVNPDFMSTLDQDGGEKGGGGKGAGGCVGGSAGPDIEVFKERLRNMGKVSRNKFAQLSKVFQRRKKNRSAKGMLEQSGAGDSMFWGAEPLLSENQDDSATVAAGGATSTTTAIGQKDSFSK